jgi:CCR4-NOT transcription complex subunit 7/8
MDNEFPSTIVCPDEKYWYENPWANYIVLKANVNRLHLIQVDLTLCNCDFNHLKLGTPQSFNWGFNFWDFNVARDPHALDSIELLRREGIDFEKNLKFGVKTTRFAELWVSQNCCSRLGYYATRILTGLRFIALMILGSLWMRLLRTCCQRLWISFFL